jgi:hypothetical protein
VLGASTDLNLNGGIPVAHAWSNFHLDDAADELVLVAPGGLEVDRVAYDTLGWPAGNGAALTLSAALLDGFLNDLPGSWCDATVPIGGGNPDLGTPAGANPSCP